MKNFDTRQIDNYLKTLYLGAVSESLNTGHPMFASIKHDTHDVWGKEIRKLVNYECNESGFKYDQYASPLKNLYVVLKLPKKIEDASPTIMRTFIEQGLGDVRNHATQIMSLELFGDGDGVIEYDKFDEVDKLNAPQKICGLGYIFDNDKPLYGLPRDKDSHRATILDWMEKSNIQLLDALSDMVLERDCDMIITSGTVKRSIQQALIATRQNIDVMSVKGGYKAISINGVPLISDRNCPTDDIYILNTPDFTMHELCDWRWLENDSGRIVRELPTKDGYYAVLVKYADLICDNVQNQLKIKVAVKDE